MPTDRAAPAFYERETDSRLGVDIIAGTISSVNELSRLTSLADKPTVYAPRPVGELD